MGMVLSMLLVDNKGLWIKLFLAFVVEPVCSMPDGFTLGYGYICVYVAGCRQSFPGCYEYIVKNSEEEV